ncbi:MAG: hypothetical protein DMF61_03020 [Blastocatellia bacterium AA13]|nr:MAG: hypothetical protein DMF61_03020 [Blastocatellia bacterium AA13]
MPPGKEGKITLALQHTEGYSGDVSKSATVATNDPNRQSFQLLLRVHFDADPNAVAATPIPLPVFTRTSGPFSMAPSGAWLTSVLRGTSTSTTIVIANDKSSPVHVKKMIPGGDHVLVRLDTIEDGKRYQLSLQTNPNDKAGKHHQVVELLTDSKEFPKVEVPIDVTIYPWVIASPDIISIPRMTLADERPLIVPPIYVRKIKDGGLKINKVSSSLPFISTNVTSQIEGSTYMIALSFDKAQIKKAGDYKGIIRIETNDPEVPVIEIPIQVKFD